MSSRNEEDYGIHNGLWTVATYNPVCTAVVLVNNYYIRTYYKRTPLVTVNFHACGDHEFHGTGCSVGVQDWIPERGEHSSATNSCLLSCSRTPP